jgi:hypothetical protein
MKLERFCYSPMGTFGTLEIKTTRETFKCFTVERPWENNEPMRSCIPEGDYKLVWYNSPRFGRTVAVVGNSVSLFPDPKYKRSAILIHSGNTMDDVLGCISPGEALGFVSGKWAVIGSKSATQKVLSLLDPVTPGNITISHYIP